MKLAGTTALVTGATGGLGQAIARSLAASGATLILSGRRADVLEATASELGARVVTADLADPDGPRRLVEETGPVDVLVANAALPASGPIMDFDTDRIDRNLQVNLHAPINLARLVLGDMIDRGTGHLVFISSVAGITSSAGSSIYSATKFGLRGFAFGVRQDLHGTGVGASVVSPGFIRDAGMFADSGAKLPPGVRTCSPDQVAAAVVTAITKDRAEIIVAPAELRAGAVLSSLSPALGERVTRRLGGQKIAADISAGQGDKR